MRFSRMILSCLFAASLLLACSSGPGPVEIAQKAFEATVSANMAAARPLYCEAMQQLFPSQEEMDKLQEELGVKFEFDYSKLQYELVEEEGDRAVVRVVGELKVTANDQSETVDYDEQMHLIRADGAWVVCEN